MGYHISCGGGHKALNRIPLTAIIVLMAIGFRAGGLDAKEAMPAAGKDFEASQAQAALRNDLPINLTDEEMSRLDEIGMGHVSTSPPPASVRRCAQWEPVTGALIRYHYGFGLPYDLIREYAEHLTLHVLCVSGQQSICYNALQSNGVNMAHVELVDIPTDSKWTRDYGPQTVFAGGEWSFVDHIYNRPRPLDDQVNWELGTDWSCAIYGTDLVHTGGNFLYDGHGTGFSTDLVWDENPGLSHSAIAQAMEAYLGITDYVVLPDISSTGIHHIDCWMKLLNEETMLVKQVEPGHPNYADLETNVAALETLTNCYGRPYNIVRVMCGGLWGSDVAAYTNSMILNGKVFVPLYGISTDSAAIAVYEAAMPGYEVMGFTGGWLSDDAIHCRTMEIPDRHMLVVDTNPLQDMEFNTGDYGVSVYIDDRSETGLVSDSMLVYWRLEGATTFGPVMLQATAYPDSYYAEIPMQADSVNIEYYVFARDNSGRTSARPPVAPAAWYTFNTGIIDVSSVKDGADGPISGDVELAQNSPNPFHETTEIKYIVPGGGYVSLKVYGVSGRHVTTLVDGYQTPGHKAVRWNGRAADGQRLPSGVYYCRLQAEGHTETKAMVLGN